MDKISLFQRKMGSLAPPVRALELNQFQILTVRGARHSHARAKKKTLTLTFC